MEKNIGLDRLNPAGLICLPRQPRSVAEARRVAASARIG
jgi:hypothetical protein